MFPDGTFVRDVDSTAIYLVQGGRLRVITNLQTYLQIGGPTNTSTSLPGYPAYQLAQFPRGAAITRPEDLFQATPTPLTPAAATPTPPRPAAPTPGMSSSPLGTSLSPTSLPLPVLVGGAVLLYVLLMRRR